jgi:hypothetical protein
MRIGTLAALAVLMIVVGLPLYSVGDMAAGAYLAVAGLLLALAAVIAAHVWAWTQDETDCR